MVGSRKTAREVKDIAALGKELYERVSVVTGHFTKLGKSLTNRLAVITKRSVPESRLLVTAKKFEALDSASPDPYPSRH